MNRARLKPKKRKCRMKAAGCEVEFWPGNYDPPMRNWCRNNACVDKKARIISDKQLAKRRSVSHQEKKVGRERLLSMPARLKRARETAFQVYVKIRDFAWFQEIGKEPACIMCGNTNPSGWDAAHFVSVGSRPELQFHPDNCHTSCQKCNRFTAQGDTQYRENLIAKVGIEMVEYLERYHATIRWDAEEVEGIRSHYKKLIKDLK